MQSLASWICIPVFLVLSSLKCSGQDIGSDLVYSVKPSTDVVDFCGQLFLDAKLENRGEKSVLVYWGDAAHGETYKFSMTHKETDTPIIACRRTESEADIAPAIGMAKYFQWLEPGDTLTYRMGLGPRPGVNTQYAFFRRPGKVRILPKLRVVTDTVVDPESKKPVSVPKAWTGSIQGQPFEITVKPPKDPKELGLHVTGKVRFPDGKPASHARVRLVSRDVRRQQAFGFIDTVQTDVDGRFRVFNVPSDAREIQFFAVHAGYPDAKLVVDKFDPDVPVILNFKTPVLIQGRVIDFKGEPIAAARVNSSWLTDRDGRFQYFDEAGKSDYSLFVWHSDYLSDSQTISPTRVARGDIKVTLYDRASMTVTGRARFIDGQAIRSSSVAVTLRDKKKEGQQPGVLDTIRCRTDVRGEFRFVLPGPGIYEASLEFHRPKQGTWSCEIDNLVPGKGLGYVLVNNRASIAAQIEYQSRLPKDSLGTITVTKRPGMRVVKKAEFRVGQETALIDGLSPGNYLVELRVDACAIRLSKEVELLDRSPSRGDVLFKCPQVHFGTVTGKLLLPDGKTPAGNATLWFEAHDHNFHVRTKPDGTFTIEQTLAKTYGAHLVGNPELSRRSFATFTVPANGTVDVGTIRLRADGEDFGHAMGKLIGDDGVPLERAVRGLYSDDNVFQVSGFVSDVRASNPNLKGKNDSEYHAKLPIGKQFLAFGKHVGNLGGGFVVQTDPELLVYQLDVQAGETLEKDFRVPSLNASKLHLRFLDSWKVARVVIRVKVPDGFWETQGSIADGEWLVPAGKCKIYVFMNRLLAIQSCDLLDGKTHSVVFSETSGTASIGLRDGSGRLKPFRCVVTEQDPGIVPAKVVAVATERQQPVHSRVKWEEGRLVLSGLSPGKYEATITLGDDSKVLAVVIKENKVTDYSVTLP